VQNVHRTLPEWRRPILVGAVVPAVITAALAVFPTSLLARLDSVVYDAFLRAADSTPPDSRVVIVDIDDRSLSSIGQWPWRRDVVAQLVNRIRDSGAAMTALDILFAEPDRSDRTSGVSNQQRPPGASGDGYGAADMALADTLRGGRAIVGYALTFDARSATDGECVLHPLKIAVVVPPDQDVESPSLFRASGTLCSLPLLTQASTGSGFLNASPDSDGVLRRMPLLIEFRDRIYPGLALAAVTALHPPQRVELRVNSHASTLILDDVTIPLDVRGNLLLRYAAKRRAFQYLSASDVLRGSLPANAFKDKVVFVGATALGTQELVTTPFESHFPGVEVQATVADNLLRGNFITRSEPPILLQALTVLLLGGAIVLIARRAGVAWTAVAAIGGIVMLWGGALGLLSMNGLFVSPLSVTAGVTLSFVLAAVHAVTSEMRAAAAGLERARGETAAAIHVKNEFLMTVSHELRTPLTAIYGYAQMLAKGALKDEHKSRVLTTIEKNARAQTQLIDDLLDVSSVVGGRLRLDVKRVDLSTVFDAAIASVRPALNAKAIALDRHIDPKATRISGDPERLQQIVWHLLSNAIKFTPNGGRIQLALNSAGAFVEVVVSDTGIGIAPSFLPHVFERFQQEDSTTTRNYGGLGLGLALVRHLAELHGGSVRAESKGQGQGATFRVWLPLNAHDDSARSARAPADAASLAGTRVLVFDHELAGRTLFASTLLNAGAMVVTAASVDDARTILRENIVDVVVCDLDSEEDGALVLKEARAASAARGDYLTAIAIMANGGDAEARAQRAGCVMHLARSVDPSALVTAIAAVTRQKAH
jgi:signal transduction histidine kinase